MDQMTNNLIQLSDDLDKAGKIKCANIVDDLIKNQSVTKVAQYVGAIGYVLKQNRAMGNCVRKKRVESNTSMQEVVLDCIKEYQDGQSYGNNEWTSKYAQVIEQTPEHFESSCMDFLEAVATENHIGDHVNQMESAHKSLEASGFKKTVISSVLGDLNDLLMEGDAGRRPFKVAAPSSQRGFWNRLWNPSWTRSGKDKDTQHEMDNVSESIANMSSSVQQVRSSISHLRYLSRSIPDPELAKNINGLSATDWNETTSRMKNVSQMLNSIKEQNPSKEILQASEILSNLNSNVRNVYDQGSRIQRNMYNLRQRDPVKGRGSLPSATNEYADLERALNRLYANPLDEKALYYSHKSHGRLEDSLNMRPMQNDNSQNNWLDEPMNHPQEIPGVSTPVDSVSTDTNAEPMQPNAPTNSPLDNPESIADGLVNQSTPEDLKAFTDLIRKILQGGNGGGSGRDAIIRLLSHITSRPPNESPEAVIPEAAPETAQPEAQPEASVEAQPEAVTTQESVAPVAKSPPVAGNLPATVTNTHMQGSRNRRKKNLQAPMISAFNIKTLRKMADAVEPLDATLTKLLHEYLENEELLPNFPEFSPILKDKTAYRLKLTQK